MAMQTRIEDKDKKYVTVTRGSGPAEKKFFETSYNFTSNSAYPYYPNLMAMQTRIEDNDKKKHVTRSSGLSPCIKGLDRQPWEFRFQKPVPDPDDGSAGDRKKKLITLKKFEQIVSDDEDNVTEDPDIELKNGTLRTIKAKKSDGVFKSSLNHSPSNKIVKRRKYPATFRLFEKWFPERTTSILSKLDTKDKTNRPEEKNCYIQLIKANLSKNNSGNKNKIEKVKKKTPSKILKNGSLYRYR